MARRKGLKQWDKISTEGWMTLLGDNAVMSQLMMRIFSKLYYTPDYTDNAKNIAEALYMEYRALNAGVGWAGNKIKSLYEEGKLAKNSEADGAEETGSEDAAGEGALKADAAPKKRAPWEYVFDGSESEDGTYFWILKPEAVRAYRELVEADIWGGEAIRRFLDEDVSAAGVEGNLFSKPSETTVGRIRRYLDEEHTFHRKSFGEHPRCTVCGAERLSLLRAVPYGDDDFNHNGLVFCPTHGSLFAAHLITFNDRGELLISDRLTDKEKSLFNLTEGMQAVNPFSRRRMAVHRRIFNQEGRKHK